ncbi:hypothetical protein [Deinococcus multiflagellatus]|uniref:Uncharacterized protein n=1 Tax=Deinococcus multiflagellatus TaxID=1656887 RepID=A0ABW1ZLA8_9DEIO
MTGRSRCERRGQAHAEEARCPRGEEGGRRPRKSASGGQETRRETSRPRTSQTPTPGRAARAPKRRAGRGPSPSDLLGVLVLLGTVGLAACGWMRQQGGTEGAASPPRRSPAARW